MVRPVHWLLLALAATPIAAELPSETTFHERIHSRILLGDGSSVVVGDRGPIDGTCSEGARALVSRRAADGSVLWTRVAHADPLVDAGATALFVGSGTPDPATVFGSSARGVRFDPQTESVAVVGEVIQVHQTPQLEADRRGFLMVLDLDGEVITGGSVGSPFGGDPPLDVPTCEEICTRLQASTGESWRPRAVAFAGDGDFVVTGSRRLADGSREAFLARMTPHLSLLWHTALGSGAPGEGRDVLVDDSGEELIFVTGTLGTTDRNVMVESYDGEGLRLSSVVSAGHLDDSGDEIVLEQDRLVISGRFNAGLSLGNQHLDAGDCERHFRAYFNRQLQPLSIEMQAVPGSTLGFGTRGQANNALAPKLLGLRVIEGFWGGGGLCQLEDSDDSYFSIGGEYVLATKSDAAFIASYEISPLAPTITHVNFEFTSDYCTELTLSLGGGTAEGFIPITTGALCPIGEPAVRVPVPIAVSHLLGFGGGGTSAEQGLPLLVKIELSFYGYSLCQQGLCASGAKDGSVDELELESDTER